MTRMHACILVLALASCSGGVKEPPAAEAQAIPTAGEKPRGFAIVEGPPPGADAPYEGELVAYARWSDIAGDNLVVLSRTTALADAEGAPDAALAQLHARRYMISASGSTLAGEFDDGAVPGTAVPEAAFYKDGVWPSDLDGDGLGEAMFSYYTNSYYVDGATGKGPKRLVLVVMTAGGTSSIRGSTRIDVAGVPRIVPEALADAAMDAAPQAIQAEARRLWEEAQFDLAWPPAWPGFFEHRRFDGASFQGDDGAWSLEVLPQYMLLVSARGEPEAAIRYDSIRAEGSGLVIEGTGEVEAWKHSFRVAIAEGGTLEFPLTITVDWSDGTRLSGTGRLAAKPLTE